MSTSFPTTLDTSPTRTNGQTIDASHMQNVQDAVVALETKVGTDNSADPTSLDYKVKSPNSTSPGHKHTSADITDPTNLTPTGTILPYAGSVAPSTSWLLCNGQAVSRSTYSALYSLIGITYGAGDGITTFNLPDLRGRTIVGVGTGTKVATFASRSSNVITVTGLSNTPNNEFQTGQAVVYSTSAGVIGGLSNGSTYYIVRVTNTTFSLASSLANAQNGSVIALSSDGSGTQTFTITFTARTLAETGGEENHAISSTETLAHTHTLSPAAANSTGNTGGGNAGSTAANSAGTPTPSSFGGNTAMNNMQPFVALNYIIRV